MSGSPHPHGHPHPHPHLASSSPAAAAAAPAPPAHRPQPPAALSPYDAPVDLNEPWKIDFSQLQLGEKIGEGYFGVVYKAKWRESTVVAKVLKNVRHGEAINFWKEVDIVSKLRSPHLVQFLAACTDPTHLCIVSEFLSHGALYELLHSPPSPEPLAMLWLLTAARQVALGLHYLHGCKPQIVHRDLTSSNVLLDTNFVAKVGDFGLSRSAAHDVSASETGNLLYMAPEAFESNAYSVKSDVYSFGVLLNEMLSRAVPFSQCGLAPNTPPARIASMVLRDGLRPRVAKRCSPLLQQLITDCWHADPAERPDFPSILRVLQQAVTDLREAPAGSMALDVPLPNHNSAAPSGAAPTSQPYVAMPTQAPQSPSTSSPSPEPSPEPDAASKSFHVPRLFTPDPDVYGELLSSFDAYGALQQNVDAEVRQFVSYLQKAQPHLGKKPVVGVHLPESAVCDPLSPPSPSSSASSAASPSPKETPTTPISTPTPTAAPSSSTQVYEHECGPGRPSRWYPNRLPRPGELVMCRVLKVFENTASFELCAYSGVRAMASLSELSRRRIRSIFKLLRVGTREVLRVLQVDEERGFVDLSKRDVTPADVRVCEQLYQEGKAAHSILSSCAEAMDVCLFCVYRHLGWPLARRPEHAGRIFNALRHALVSPVDVLGPFMSCKCFAEQRQRRTSVDTVTAHPTSATRSATPSVSGSSALDAAFAMRMLTPRVLPEIERRSEAASLTLELDLSSLGLRTLPRRLLDDEARCATLKRLNLEDNRRLRGLPSEIGRLQALEELNLNNCELEEELPAELSRCSSLLRLFLYGNSLSRVPTVIPELYSMQVLNLNNNGLVELPESFGQLRHLRELGLHRNRLTTLPSSFSRLRRLRSLDLSGNMLSSFPDEILTLSLLASLELQDNQITDLPASLSRLQRLEWLDVSCNRLTSLPDELVEMISRPLVFTDEEEEEDDDAEDELGGAFHDYESPRLDWSGSSFSPSASPLGSPAGPTLQVQGDSSDGDDSDTDREDDEVASLSSSPSAFSSSFRDYLDDVTSSERVTLEAMDPKKVQNYKATKQEKKKEKKKKRKQRGKDAGEPILPVLQNARSTHQWRFGTSPSLPSVVPLLQSDESSELTADEQVSGKRSSRASARARGRLQYLDVTGNLSLYIHPSMVDELRSLQQFAYNTPEELVALRRQQKRGSDEAGGSFFEDDLTPSALEDSGVFFPFHDDLDGDDDEQDDRWPNSAASAVRSRVDALTASSRAVSAPEYALSPVPMAQPAVVEAAIETWSCETVVEWLRASRFGEYGDTFAENEIDGAVLLGMTDQDLRYMGIKKLGPLRKILGAISKLKSSATVCAETGQHLASAECAPFLTPPEMKRAVTSPAAVSREPSGGGGGAAGGAGGNGAVTPLGCALESCELVRSVLLSHVRQTKPMCIPESVRAVVRVTSPEQGLSAIQHVLRAGKTVDGPPSTPFDGLYDGCEASELVVQTIFPPLYVVSLKCLFGKHGVSVCEQALSTMAACAQKIGAEFEVVVAPYNIIHSQDRNEVLKTYVRFCEKKKQSRLVKKKKKKQQKS